MKQSPREVQYVSDEKFNWNRILSLPFAQQVEVSDITRLSLVHTGMDRFPDISYYQKEVNYEILSTKTKAVIVRCQFGGWIDPQFVRNYTRAKEKGMKRGIYLFYDDRVSPQKHMEVLKSLLDVHGLPEMEIWVDWENTYGGQHAGLKNVVALMQLIEQEYPDADVGMYTGFWWFVEHSNPIANFFQYQYLKNKPLWLASYTDDITRVRVPAPWTTSTWRHWQYGTPSIGVAMGVATEEIDMNLYVDDTVTWTNRYGEDGTTNDDEEGDDMALVSATLKEGQHSNLRDAPGTVGTNIIRLLTGPLNIVAEAEKQYKDNYWWSRMVSPETGWIAWTTSYTTPVPFDPNEQPNPDRKIVSITIINPESVDIEWDDGTRTTHQ